MASNRSIGGRAPVWGTLGLCALFLVTALGVSPFFGAEDVDALSGLNLILRHGFTAPLPDDLPGGDQDQVLRSIVSNRILRSWMGVVAGAGLAVIGAALQAILRNPLVAPSTLGVSTAAAVGAFCAIIGFGPGLTWGPFSPIQVAAYLAAVLDIVLIYGIARLAGRPHALATLTCWPE